MLNFFLKIEIGHRLKIKLFIPFLADSGEHLIKNFNYSQQKDCILEISPGVSS